jgi:TolA-binding protein
MSARISTLSLTLALACVAKPSGEGPGPTEPEPEPVVFVEAVPDPAKPEPTQPVMVLTVGADGPTDAELENAKQLFKEGMNAYESGDYAEAVAYFEQAYVLSPMPELLFNIAHCHEQLGDVAAACDLYMQVEGDPEIDQGTRQAAADRAAKLHCG